MTDVQYDEIELTDTERKELARIAYMRDELGMTDDQIFAALNQSAPTNAHPAEEYSFSQDIQLPPLQLDFSYDEKAAFKQKPEKPSFFKGAEQLQPHRSKLELPSDKEYVLNGVTRNVRKLNLKDTLRLIAKVPVLANYMGYNTPAMLVDEMTGRYRWAETILTLFERAFSDYDLELDRPTDFSLAVLEEVVILMGLQNVEASTGEKGVAYLLEQDPDEVYDAVARLVEYNQGFFTKIYQNPLFGPIRSLISSIIGRISKATNGTSGQASPANSATKPSSSAT